MLNFYRILNKRLIECKIYLETLDCKIFTNEEILHWFEELCRIFTNIINLIVEAKPILHENLKNEQKEALFLHLKQCSTLLSLLINVFVTESEVLDILTEARNFSIRQLLWCLEAIKDALTKNIKHDPSGNFIDWMDKSLDKIAEIHEADGREMEIFKEAKLLIEEVLCHAMSIAQVALHEDCKILKGSSQAVLNAMDSLINEIEKPVPNKAMIKLFVDTCSDKLCSLESRVNTTVLKLSLKVFSEYTTSLKEIHDFCFDGKNNGQTDKLDLLVADFDFHVDRIMQIGLFAVSVTSPAERIIKIKSCLASLEGLESELVPAFTSVLLDHSIHNVNFALILEKHWMQEASTLQQLIFLIIDPLAFCQVIYEENKQIIENLSDIVKISGVDKKLVRPFINNSTVLKEFLPIAISESQEAHKKTEGDKISRIKCSLRDFKIVFHELKAACKVILLDNTNTTNLGSLKILKRCKILMTFIKDMRHYYIQQEVVHDNTIDSSSNIVSKEEPPKANKFLDHIINRGNQILKDRSILYRTSIKKEVDVQTSAIKKIQILKGQKNKSIPLSKLVHLKKFSAFGARSRLDVSEDDNLQITDILKDLSNFSNTISQLK